MKMSKRFEKKLIKFAKSIGIDTNFNWDVGWFDFNKDLTKLGSIRFYGACYDIVSKTNRYNIYCVTAFTRIVYLKYSFHYPIKENPYEIWDSTCDSATTINENECLHESIFETEVNNYTEDKIIEFLKDCFTRCLNGKFYAKMEDKLQTIKDVFR